MDEDDIDIILITEPRKTSESSAFTHIDVWYYKNFVNSNVIVVHRLNECDERKNTKFVNKYLLRLIKLLITQYLLVNGLEIYIKIKVKYQKVMVIMAGADKSIFNIENRKVWDGKEKLKITTHHWGANWNKGFEIYKKIDKMLDEDHWKNLFEFTYIGNLPKKFSFNNTKVIEPISGDNLAKEIKKIIFI